MSELRIFRLRVKVEEALVEDIGWVKVHRDAKVVCLDVRRDGTMKVNRNATMTSPEPDAKDLNPEAIE